MNIILLELKIIDAKVAFFFFFFTTLIMFSGDLWSLTARVSLLKTTTRKIHFVQREHMKIMMAVLNYVCSFAGGSEHRRPWACAADPSVQRLQKSHREIGWYSWATEQTETGDPPRQRFLCGNMYIQILTAFFGRHVISTWRWNGNLLAGVSWRPTSIGKTPEHSISGLQYIANLPSSTRSEVLTISAPLAWTAPENQYFLSLLSPSASSIKGLSERRIPRMEKRLVFKGRHHFTGFRAYDLAQGTPQLHFQRWRWVFHPHVQNI